MPAAVRGEVGEIRWRYYIAATTGRYVVTRSDGRWSLATQLIERDAYKLTQTPLVFIARHPRGAWHWPIRSLSIDETGRVVATLDPPVD